MHARLAETRITSRDKRKGAFSALRAIRGPAFRRDPRRLVVAEIVDTEHVETVSPLIPKRAPGRERLGSGEEKSTESSGSLNQQRPTRSPYAGTDYR